ncbi:MAG: ABC transporter ATP-binding protein/permease [Propionibacteriaceae bacterium]|jgi:putative ABC transport system permease protein|nr:ABC transporter ATP-binding protein/permease [Propionibacteriaceae bacterium]
MLELKDIVKDYLAGDTLIPALRGVSLSFRASDFVAVLGPSGCGKTTLLNIVGGLDRYTSGDLTVNGVSTREYRDADWDVYRNNSVGFVFQSYNLIPHQSVLSNVELAMTLAGVSRDERRRRAVEALTQVGLLDQVDKKPTQLSGGQMQRVAIARALVNNPDILLADEPTGALDSETSLQIMEILKTVARDRLVVMVTHNSELAEKYATRVIRLLDGKVLSDSAPYEAPALAPAQKKRQKVSMSLPTALSLSFRNLLTKKTRTLLTAFAGSIGIIGIALILSLSSGMNAYIADLERDTLSTYPLEIQSQTVDMSGMMAALMSGNNSDGIDHDLDKVYSNNIMSTMISSLSTASSKNDLLHFKEYIEGPQGTAFSELTSSIQYGYGIDLQVYASDTSSGVTQLNPTDLLNDTPMAGAQSNQLGFPQMSVSGGMNLDIWEELIDNQDLLEAQYDLVYGEWPDAFDELVLVVDENNEISDWALYSLGLLDPADLKDMRAKVQNGEKVEEKPTASFSYEELAAADFKLLANSDRYAKEDGRWVDKSDDAAYMKALVDKAADLRIVGIVRPGAETVSAVIGGSIGYTALLTDHVIEAVSASEIAKEQLADPDRNVFTGLPFEAADLSAAEARAFITALLPPEQQAALANMADEQILELVRQQAQSQGSASYADNCSLLGIVNPANPASISLYPKDFESKEKIVALIGDYNAAQQQAGQEQFVINYTDLVGVLTSSVSSIIDIISYVLMAFVAISLVVSSIMIAIITYISVLERTKEIGILRSIGASKRDISRLFNAETIIEGLGAGVLGVVIAVLLDIPISLLIKSLVDISSLAQLPLWGAAGLIVISVLLTLVAGWVPSRIAAKKDPVEALRTE